MNEPVTFPFAGFASRDDYPPTGLNTDRWKFEIQPIWVMFDRLYLVQDGVYIAALFDDSTPMFGDYYPHAVAHGDRLYLEDGHHRVVRDAVRGSTGGVIRVFESP